MLGLGLLLGIYSHCRRNLGESVGNWNLVTLICEQMGMWGVGGREGGEYSEMGSAEGSVVTGPLF